MKGRFVILTLGLAGVLALPAFALPQERGDRKEQSADRADEHAKAEYHFRQEDGAKLRQHYKGIEKVDVHHRSEYRAGARMPDDWRKRIHPVPAAAIRELPPAPAGYAFGYLDGYCVVYDPTTLLIADVIDLATLAR